MNIYPPVKKEKPKRERGEKGKFVRRIPVDDNESFFTELLPEQSTKPSKRPHRRPNRYRTGS